MGAEQTGQVFCVRCTNSPFTPQAATARRPEQPDRRAALATSLPAFSSSQGSRPFTSKKEVLRRGDLSPCLSRERCCFSPSAPRARSSGHRSPTSRNSPVLCRSPRAAPAASRPVGLSSARRARRSGRIQNKASAARSPSLTRCREAGGSSPMRSTSLARSSVVTWAQYDALLAQTTGASGEHDSGRSLAPLRCGSGARHYDDRTLGLHPVEPVVRNDNDRAAPRLLGARPRYDVRPEDVAALHRLRRPPRRC